MKLFGLSLNILFSRMIALLILASVGVTLWLSAKSPLAREMHHHRSLTALWVGMTQDKETLRPETILLARYNPQDRSLNILSVPCQTKVHSSRRKGNTLADVYIKSMQKNPQDFQLADQELFRATLELFSLSTAAAQSLFRNTVSQTCFLNLREEDLQSLVHWFGSVPLPAEVAVSTAVAAPEARARFPLKLVHTNLNALEKSLLCLELKDLRREDIHWLTIQGTVKNQCLLPDPEELLSTSKLFWGSTSGLGERYGIHQGRDRSKITVGVWNASDKKNVALDLVRRLRRTGFDVVEWGNYPTRRRKGWVEDHAGQIRQAREIASLLFSSRSNVYTCVKNKSLVDMDVVVGDQDVIKEN